MAQKLGAPLSLERSLHALARGTPHGGRLKRQLAAALARAPREEQHAHRGCRALLGADKHAQLQALQAPHERSKLARTLLSDKKEACEVDHHTTDIRFDPHTFITTAVVSAQVKRPVSDFAKQSDPRNWATVAPIAFQQSYQVQLAADGSPRQDEDGCFLALLPGAPGASALGSSWRGKMFEDVVFAVDELQLSQFRNLLNIQFEVTRERVRMDFSLYRAVSCDVVVRELPGGLDVDDGFFSAEPVRGRKGWTQITGKKRVRFCDLTPSDSPYMEPATSGQYLNYMAPSLVGIFMDEFIYNGACFGLANEGRSA